MGLWARFTSLGGIDNTKPNEHLRNPERACGYDPAYMLKNHEMERGGRM